MVCSECKGFGTIGFDATGKPVAYNGPDRNPDVKWVKFCPRCLGSGRTSKEDSE